MKSWCFVGNQLYNEHYQFISNLLNSKQIKNSIEFLSETPQEFNIENINALKKYDFVLFDENFQDHVAPLLSTTYLDLDKLNSIDLIIKEKGENWWPTNKLKDAFVKWVSTDASEVNVTSPALLIGSNGLTRSILAGMCKVGFTNIIVTDVDLKKTTQMVEDLKKIYFNLEIQQIPPDDITLLSGVHSLVINTVDVFSSPEFFKELFYCNYLKKGAIVLDLNRYPLETPLLKLSRGIGAKTVPGFNFFAFHDVCWIEKMFGVLLPVTELKPDLEKIYSKIPYDEAKLFDLNF